MTFFTLSILLLLCINAHDEAAAKEGQAKLPLKFGIFREDCFEKFVNKGDFGDAECIKFTLSKAIGFAVVVGSGVLKLP